MKPAFLMSVVLAAAFGSAAHATQSSASDIRSEIVGKRIYLATPFGGEFPLNYRSSGRVDGDGEALGLGRFVKPQDRGKWWIDGNRLCQQFTTWYDGEAMCFDLYRIGNRQLKWIRNNGQTGTARIGSSL